jgi:hypothetical protein
MAMIRLPKDFKDFLKLLNELEVRYLVIGGYAVGYYGYPRATNDLDIWIELKTQNADKLVKALNRFGFVNHEIKPEIFLKEDQIIRIGHPPVRIELLTSISGVRFDDCYQTRKTDSIDGVEMPLIGFKELIRNKKASGRHKDLNDIENLPGS